MSASERVILTIYQIYTVVEGLTELRHIEQTMSASERVILTIYQIYTVVEGLTELRHIEQQQDTFHFSQ